MNIPDCTELQKLYESSDSLILRAFNQAIQKKVIVKLLKENASYLTISHYEREYQMLKQLPEDGVIQAYSMEKNDNSIMIVFEDFGGIPLKDVIQKNNFSLLEKLAIAIDISKILAGMHSSHIFHTNINPSNILMNTDTRQIKIIDFGAASQRSQLSYGKIDLLQMKDHLNYISPEQTGLMNRMTDFRTDFYSLGITLYELFCNRCPFESDDDNDIIFGHTAIQPVPLFSINPKIPKTVNDIIMSLIEKMPEDRYQCASDISDDLYQCFDQLKTNHKIAPFELNRSKSVGTFSISQKLYGRKNERQLLFDTFERVCNGSVELMFVSGYAGIGKTKLIREIYGPVIQKRGFFIFGKFDQFQREIPYRAWINAFRELIRILLTENPDQIKKWSAKILAALGDEAQVIIDIIPELELIVGSQKPASETDPEKMQQRFYYLCCKLIRVFCQPDHPMAVFLDDAQWIDSGSLNLLESVMTQSENQHLFIMIAYRDNEMPDSHPLKIIIEKMENNQAAIQHISLSNLKVKAIGQFISDSLHTDQTSILPLAELIVQKTQGNPMFSIEFLKSIYSENLLRYSELEGKWIWNTETINQRMVEKNVADILTKRIKMLSQTTIHVLKLASCLGNKFDHLCLKIICEHSSAKETSEVIEEAIAERLIIPLFTSYDFVKSTDDDNQISQLEYNFAHDRIQEAANLLISDEEKPCFHWHVGMRLFKKLPESLKQTNFFIIIDNLNRGQDTIEYQKNRAMLAEINLAAAKKARDSVEYQMTYKYSLTGIHCMTEESWVCNYTLAFDLYFQSAEAAYLTGNYHKMEQYIQMLLENAKTDEEKAKVHVIQLMAYTAQNQFMEAVEIGKSALKLLGIHLPEKISKYQLVCEYLKLKFLFRKKTIEKLYHLPEMTDPIQKLILKINTMMCFSAYYTCPELLIFIAISSLYIIKKFGSDHDISPVILISFGYITGAILEKYDTAFQLGSHAMQLLHKCNSKEFESKSIMIFAHFIFPWKQSFRQSLPLLMKAYQSGLETGDFEYAANSIYLYNAHMFISGVKLDDITSRIPIYQKELENIKQPMSLQMANIYWQTITNFIEVTEAPYILNGQYMNEADFKPQSRFFHAALCNMYNLKLMLCYVFGDFQKAKTCAQLAIVYLDSLIGTFASVIYCFYSTLTELALLENHSIPERMKRLKKIAANQKKLQKWASHSEDNFLYMFYLVKAEHLRVLAKDRKAIVCYKEAIRLAKKNKFTHNEALANEVFARFYLSREKFNLARAHMLDAHRCYFQWGALAKVKDIEKRYSRMFDDVSSMVQNDLDIQSLIQASQAISKEIDLENLLKTMMKITIVTAGAQKGIVLLKKNNELVVAGKISREYNDDSTLLNATYLPDFPLLHNYNQLKYINKIIYYVEKTKELIVLDKDTKQHFLQDDSNNIPLSVLCMPIQEKDELSGILYLENRLSNDIFTEQKIQVLQILSSQIAISIKNAINYESLIEARHTLEKRVSERTAQIIHVENRIKQGETSENIADRINQPLTIIRLLADDLYEYFKYDLYYYQCVHNIVLNVDHASKIIYNLMLFSKEPADNPKSIMLDQSIELLLSFFNAFLQSQNIKLSVDISREIPAVNVNPVKFQQVVIHLLSNAIFAVNERYQTDQENHYQKTIKVRLYVENNCAVFKIRDNGVGMSPEVLKHCMEPLFTTRNLPHGIGLGLYIVHKNAAESNMTIDIDSILLIGTSVHVFMPFA
jgi:predicted ATPase/signal transduction histidine kinase/tRNA A-37 threonylcarbamoyl transferase component Bud32